MNWELLISEEQLCHDKNEEPKEWEKYNISVFEKDYKKIISSSAFRRLQDKTQVFPLDKSDFVRTRLTHSLEVSMLAKQLSVMVYRGILNKEEKYPDRDYGMSETASKKMGDILSCAGLLHDLGNPPFGHFGETVIGEWFSRKFDQKDFVYNGMCIGNFLKESMKNDLKNFEGNAQSIRLLLKSQNEETKSDLNLSYTVAHTLLKYPTNSSNFAPKDPDIKKHKYGYFVAEEEIVKEIAETLGTKQKDDILRHPLTFLLEAADDIAYATADLEDAFKKGMFTLNQFVDFYKDELNKATIVNEYEKEKVEQLIELLTAEQEEKRRTQEGDAVAFNEWVKYARGWLMYCAAFRFVSSYFQIMNGTYQKDLFENTFHSSSIIILKDAMKKFVFGSESILKLELSAHTIISFLLDKLIPAVIYFEEDEEKGKQTSVDKKFTNIISENYKNDYRRNKREDDDAYNLYLRLLMVTDYISGMTDSFAKNLYQELNGIV